MLRVFQSFQFFPLCYYTSIPFNQTQDYYYASIPLHSTKQLICYYTSNPIQRTKRTLSLVLNFLPGQSLRPCLVGCIGYANTPLIGGPHISSCLVQCIALIHSYYVTDVIRIFSALTPIPNPFQKQGSANRCLFYPKSTFCFFLLPFFSTLLIIFSSNIQCVLLF